MSSSSSSATHGALVLFGSGPGVGSGVAKLFAERGFSKVILLSRNADRLSHEADAVREAGAAHSTAVHTISADVGDTVALNDSFAQVDEALSDTPLDCVFFNAARLGKSTFFEFEPQDLENDLKIAVVGLYAVAQWAFPKLLTTAGPEHANTPSFLISSGMLAKDPSPAVFSLATCKAAQLSLIKSLHKTYEPKGVHCCAIIIAGTVSPDSKVTTPRRIAEEAYRMYIAPKGKGEAETILMDPAFEEHVKAREKLQ